VFVPDKGTKLVLGEALKGSSRLGSKALLFAIAAQAALVAGLEAAGRIRRGLRGRTLEDVGEGFAWQKRAEVELESGGARLKLYTSTTSRRVCTLGRPEASGVGRWGSM